MTEIRQRRPGEGLFALVILAISVILFWLSYRIAGFSSLSSPGAFPMAASGAMVFAAILVVVKTARAPREQAGEPVMPLQIVLFTLLVGAYALTLAPLGFVPASFLFLVVGTKMLYRAGWPATVGLAISALIVVYVIFRIVFQVILPEGIFPDRAILAAIERLVSGDR